MKIIESLKINKWLIVILVIAGFLRIYKLDFQSIWLDEILSMNNSNPKLSLKQLYDAVMFWEFIPHLYFYILRLFFEVFGFSTLVARVPSVIFGIIGVYAVYLLGKELINKKTGLIAAAFIAVNIYHISYSQEARPYSMLFLFSVLAFYRLIILIKNPNYKNAIYYGLFAGLIINSHFFGFITVFSQVLILLFFLIKTKKEERKTFLIFSAVSGIVFLLLVWLTKDALLRVSEITSFWLQKPGADAFGLMIKEFFGNSEMIILMLNVVTIFYFIKLFSTRIQDGSKEAIVNNKMIFSFIILVFWLIVSIVIPLLRSHLDVPMILSRYFINILPVYILVISIGIIKIKNKIAGNSIIFLFILFSLIDVFAVNKYYQTVKKTQFRELTNEIKLRNSHNSKIVCYWSWLFPYFFEDKPTTIEGKSLTDYVAGLRNGSIQKDSFWYADANYRPYDLKPEDDQYLKENFVIKEQIQFHDAWANYYVSLNEKEGDTEAEKVSLQSFSPLTFDQNNSSFLFENTTLRTKPLNFKKGTYEIIIKANSLPSVPINGENAHFIIKVKDKIIADYFLSENTKTPERKFTFEIENESSNQLIIDYVNDMFENGKDRNAVIYSVELKKQNN